MRGSSTVGRGVCTVVWVVRRQASAFRTQEAMHICRHGACLQLIRPVSSLHAVIQRLTLHGVTTLQLYFLLRFTRYVTYSIHNYRTYTQHRYVRDGSYNGFLHVQKWSPDHYFWSGIPVLINCSWCFDSAQGSIPGNLPLTALQPGVLEHVSGRGTRLTADGALGASDNLVLRFEPTVR